MIHRSLFLAATCVAAPLALAAAPASAIEVQRVVSPGGVEAWLVQDESVPVVSLEFSFEGGAALDPEGKEGLANLASTMLDEGAGPYDSQAYQKRLNDLSISLDFTAGADAFFGSLKTLKANEAEAYELLSYALTQPRFDAEPLARMKAAVLAKLRDDMSDPSWVASRAFFENAFAGHPYARPTDGTPDTVAALTAEDLAGFAERRFARDNLLVTAAGDVTPEELGAALDKIFGALPETAAPSELPEAEMKRQGDTLLTPRSLPQTMIMVGQPGIAREDPDFYAAYVMNYILGGGGFSSRLTEEIREKRGLTYGVGASLIGLDEAPLILASTSTMNARAGETLDILKKEWARMATEGVTQEELNDAVTYLTGSYPLQFSSTDAVARNLLGIRREDLGIDYVNRRNDLIRAVTVEDVGRVAARMLDPDALLTVLVGQPEGVTPTETAATAR